MPGGDRTGPMGMGPRTGRAAGYCSGFDMPGYANPVPGRGWGRGFGFGWGRGFGRGWGRGFGRGWGRGFGRGWGRGFWGGAYPSWGAVPPPPVPGPISAKDEMEALKTQSEYLEKSLESIRERIAELESRKDEGN